MGLMSVAKPSCLKRKLSLLLYHLLQRDTASDQLGLDGGEAGQRGLAQAVALHLAGDGGGGLFYGCYGAQEGQQVSLVHAKDLT